MKIYSIAIIMIAAFLMGFMIQSVQPQQPSQVPTPIPLDYQLHALEASLWNLMDLGKDALQRHITAYQLDNPACRHHYFNIETMLELFTVISCTIKL